ncbi:CoA transferase, partial [Streptococcus sp. CCH8-C6]|uniref:CoA transferase n=1 Tax=Streptococcus sp. CCH8-C6 TaxID=1768777 RepID=UPI0018D2033F
GPLADLVVIEMGTLIAGPFCGQILGDFGAEVIRIEDRNRLDMPRRLPIYKGEARTYGEEDANPDPNKGGL